MFEISKEVSFSGAHHLREYQGKCEAVHGHNWRIKAFVAARELDRLGMVIDFKALTGHMTAVLERFDHKDLNAVPPFDEINPSSENLAKFLFDELAARIDDGRVRVSRIMVWETGPSCASYSRDG
jgi:6-pyruvoyltetrahydropterin/6-carboxytetrahydropterin synthase